MNEASDHADQERGGKGSPPDGESTGKDTGEQVGPVGTNGGDKEKRRTAKMPKKGEKDGDGGANGSDGGDATAGSPRVDDAVRARVDAPTGLKKHTRKAQRISQDKDRVKRLLAEAAAKAAKSRDRLGDAWQDLQTMFRLLRAWVTGRYKQVPWRVVVLSIAAILYFVNPLDLIPDFLGIGLLDDIGVLALAMSQLRGDLDAFRSWERDHPEGPEAA